MKINVQNDRLDIVSSKNKILGYWDKETLKKSFERKLPKIMYVKAESKGSGRNEEFWFNEAYVLSGFDFENFVKLLSKGLIVADIRIGQYADGRPHDHGTGFRVLPKNLELCFKQRKKIM